MAYKKPGAYARFVKTAGAVNSPGATRVMALVGTGKMSYDKVNEAVLRVSGSTSDKLENAGVLTIHEIASKPIKTGATTAQVDGATIYKKDVDFTLEEGNIIAWKLKTGAEYEPKAVKLTAIGDGPTAFADKVSVQVGAQNYLVKDATYRIQITYVDNNSADGPNGTNIEYGTYAVIDNATEEVLGEFKIGTSAVKAIPGVDLTVTDVFFPKTQSVTDPDTGITTEENVIDPVTGLVESITQVGDYILVQTTAGVIDDALDFPEEGSIYYATYEYKKPESDYLPKVFTDYNDVVAEFGNYEVYASGKIVNSLALGAEIAFLNGVQPLVLVQAKNDSDYEMKKAVDLLERDVTGVSNFNVIVPLTESSGVGSYLKDHVVNMSAPSVGKERMTYIAAPDSEEPTDSANVAKLINEERVVYVVPGAAIKDIKDLSTGRINQRRVPGCYIAVAVAAVGLKNDPAEPLTLKNITGFSSLGTLYSEAEKNIMAEQGCLIVEQYGYNMRIRHGITTATTDINSSEITMVQVKDYVIQAVRSSLGDLYIGKKLLPSVVHDAQATLQNILNQFTAQQVILGSGGVAVKRSTDDPRAIDVQFEIEAIYPLNYINISFSFSGVA